MGNSEILTEILMRFDLYYIGVGNLTFVSSVIHGFYTKPKDFLAALQMVRNRQGCNRQSNTVPSTPAMQNHSNTISLL
jgi:hypothetical protein